MKIKDIQESTVAGSIASVAKPLGELQTRSKPEKAPKVVKGKKYANTISEGAVKQLAYDLIHMDPKEFQQVYKRAKEFFQKPPAAVPPANPAATTSTKTGSKVWHDTGYTDKKAAKAAQKADEPIQEDELKEEDLIILPGMLRGKDKSFVPREHDRRDHEVEMARSDVYAAAKDAMRIFKILEARTEDEGLMGWQQSYITLAADYLNSVADSLDYDAISNEGTVGKIVNAIAKNSAKNLPKTPETHRAIANQAMKIEKNLDRAVKVGTAAAGGAAGKEVYDKSKKTNEGAGVIAGGMSNFEESMPLSSLTSRYLDDPNHPDYKSTREPQKEKTLQDILKDEDFKALQIWAQDNSNNPLVKGMSAAGDAAFNNIRQKLGLAGKMSYEIPADVMMNKINPVIRKAMFDYLRTHLQGVTEVRRSSNPYDQYDQEEAAMALDRRRFKWDELSQELKGEEEAARRANEGPWYIRIDGKLVRDKNKDPYVFNTLSAASKAAQTMMQKDWNKGKQFSYSRTPTDAEKKLEEKKDACYTKVKSRYKVWPSAYASGALSKCRKVGASNWGNKSKK